VDYYNHNLNNIFVSFLLLSYRYGKRDRARIRNLIAREEIHRSLWGNTSACRTIYLRKYVRGRLAVVSQKYLVSIFHDMPHIAPFFPENAFSARVDSCEGWQSRTTRERTPEVYGADCFSPKDQFANSTNVDDKRRGKCRDRSVEGSVG